jgi:hypothetical protein
MSGYTASQGLLAISPLASASWWLDRLVSAWLAEPLGSSCQSYLQSLNSCCYGDAVCRSAYICNQFCLSRHYARLTALNRRPLSHVCNNLISGVPTRPIFVDVSRTSARGSSGRFHQWVTSRKVNLFWGNISEDCRDSCRDPINCHSSKEQVLSPITRIESYSEWGVATPPPEFWSVG